MRLADGARGRGLCRHAGSFVLATKLTTSANAIFLQATAPLSLLFIAPW